MNKKTKILIGIGVLLATLVILMSFLGNSKYNVMSDKIAYNLNIVNEDKKDKLDKFVKKNYTFLSNDDRVINALTKYAQKSAGTAKIDAKDMKDKITEQYNFVKKGGLHKQNNQAALDKLNEKSAGKPANPKLQVPKDKLPVATIDIDGIDEMKFELYPNEAPESVYNFIDLANSGFYDGLIIHRLIHDFVAQGGDPKGDGTGGPGYSIKGEFASNGVKNEHLNKKGSLSWARSSDKDSAGSQFYINLNDNTSLDGDYAAFGQIISGENGLDQLNKIKADDSDKPEKTLKIKSIKVDTKGIDYPKEKKLDEK